MQSTENNTIFPQPLVVRSRVSQKKKSYIWRSTTLYIFQPWSLRHHKKNSDFSDVNWARARKFRDIQRKILYSCLFHIFFPENQFSVSVECPISILRARQVNRHLTWLRLSKMSMHGIHAIFSHFRHFCSNHHLMPIWTCIMCI